MAVDGWHGSTQKDVHSIVGAMQQQSPNWIARRWTRFGGGKVEWEALPTSSGGVFASVSESPAWAARFALTPGNGRGGAHCDVEVFDRGSHREVIVRPAYSAGLGARAKDILNGMVAAATG